MGSFFTLAERAANPLTTIKGAISDPRDPIGGAIQRTTEGTPAGATLDRWGAQDPVFGNSGVLGGWTKNVMPAAYGMQQQYVNRNNPGDTTLPAGYSIAGPYAGLNPTMSGASTGYAPSMVQAAQAQQQRQQATAGQQPSTGTQQQSRQNAAYSLWG